MNALQYLNMRLDGYINDREKSKLTLIENIERYGIGDRLGWLETPLRDDALGLAASHVKQRLGDGESLEVILADRKDELMKQTTYIIPSNTDTAFKVFQLQALMRINDLLESTIDYIARDEAKVK